MRKICRFLFSRYFISAIMILLELALMLYIALFASRYSVYTFAAMIVVHILGIISLINRDVNPEYKVSWLTVMLLVPVFGILLYIMFYSHRVPKKKADFMRAIYEAHDGAQSRYLSSVNSIPETDGAGHAKGEKELGYISERDLAFEALSECSPHAAGRANSILVDDSFARLYRGSHADYFPLGELMYEKMLSDLSHAEKYIFLEYFIIEEGVMWRGILDILKEKVASGVEVRVIYDDIGCMKTLPRGFEKKMAELGILARRFAPVNPRVTVAHNNRDHRKILVIDGKIAYTGGINIADEYINKKARFGHWKDGGVRIAGGSAVGFLILFLSMWDHTVGSLSETEKYFPPRDGMVSENAELTADRNADEKFTQDICDGGFYLPFSTGPSPIYNAPTGKNAILGIINQATRYVYITTPYLIVDYDLTEALRSAARRGIDVRIITPHIPDKKLVYLMTKSSYPYLMSAGVKIYEYTPGFIHEKLIVSDDDNAIVGTVNLDYRSLAHHYEDAVWIYRSPVVLKIRDSFKDTVSVSRELSRESTRLTLNERIIRSIMRIFAPLM